MATHKTVYDNSFILIDADKKYNYQSELTAKLDSGIELFDQETINEIVLWKVNRYATVKGEALRLINNIHSKTTELDEDLTRNVLMALLQIKGIQLPMASTILRFRNKNIYQIIDQRVYRIIYQDRRLKLKSYPSDKNLNDQIELYLQYLKDLRTACKHLNIPFFLSDRILFMADRRVNKDIPLDNY